MHVVRETPVPSVRRLLVPTVPKMEFQEREHAVDESDGQVVATVRRTGDLRHRSSVRCYSRQGSAQVMADFEERPNTDSSLITFLPGAGEPEIFPGF